VAQEKQPAWVFDRRTVTTESISVLVSAHGSPKTFAVGSWFHGAWPVVWSTAGIPERLRLRLEGPGQPGAQNSIAVYGIGAGNSLLFKKVDPLRKYADSTGGRVFYPWKTRGFAETYQRISETARNQYVLGYVQSNDLKDGEYRSIVVRLNRAGFAGKVRNRKSYYASLNP